MNFSLSISALVLYILHLLALAATLIVVVASCCCWLATRVHNLMHTWWAVVCVYAQGFTSCSSHSNRPVYSAPPPPLIKSVIQL